MLIPHFLVLLVPNVLYGAGSGNRTHLSSLEGWSITDIRYPQILKIISFVLLRQFRHFVPHLCIYKLRYSFPHFLVLLAPNFKTNGDP